MDIISKVKKLIALSTSPNGNEANNAAKTACSLILKHNLEFRGASKRDSLRIIHTKFVVKCIYCKLGELNKSMIYDEDTNEIFHYNCFLIHLGAFDRDYGTHELTHLEEDDIDYE